MNIFFRYKNISFCTKIGYRGVNAGKTGVWLRLFRVELHSSSEKLRLEYPAKKLPSGASTFWSTFKWPKNQIDPVSNGRKIKLIHIQMSKKANWIHYQMVEKSIWSTFKWNQIKVIFRLFLKWIKVIFTDRKQITQIFGNQFDFS